MKILPKIKVPIQHPYLLNKYTYWYYSIISIARNRPSINSYKERHHIIPESLFINRTRRGPKGYWPGNPNDKQNLIYLTAREHYICHRLLTKITTGPARDKMIRAAWKMCFSDKRQDRNYRIPSRVYAELRSAYAQLQRDKLKGKPGRPHTESTKAKLSKINKGKKGPPVKPETRLKLSIALTGRKRPPFSQEWREKLAAANKGRKGTTVGLKWWNNGSENKLSEKSPGSEWIEGQIKFKKTKSNGSKGMFWWNNGTINKMSNLSPGEEWNKGRLLSTTAQNEIKDRMLEQIKNGNHPFSNQGIFHPNKIQVTCPHCNLTGGRANMMRYHFDRCKNI